MSLYPKRKVHVPRRFDPNDFVPGANNKYTAGRKIDVGHSIETEADRLVELEPIDEEFIVGDVLSEESECEESECEESEGEWESEDEECECEECEWDSEECDGEDESSSCESGGEEE